MSNQPYKQIRGERTGVKKNAKGKVTGLPRRDPNEQPAARPDPDPPVAWPADTRLSVGSELFTQLARVRAWWACEALVDWAMRVPPRDARSGVCFEFAPDPEGPGVILTLSRSDGKVARAKLFPGQSLPGRLAILGWAWTPASPRANGWTFALDDPALRKILNTRGKY